MKPACRPRRARHSAIQTALLAAALTAIPQARAIDVAEWVGTVPGNWSTAGNWLCDINGAPQGPCVPGPDFAVTLAAGADVTLDVHASVSQVVGDYSTRFRIGAGLTLTASAAPGINVGVLSLDQGAWLGSTIVGATNLFVFGATISASDSIGSAFQTEIWNSQLSSLSSTGDLLISGSVINNLASAPSFSSLSVLASNINTPGGVNEILNSVVHATIIVDQGVSLLIDQGSTISTPAALAARSISVNSGALTVTGGSTISANLTPVSVGNGAFGPGSLFIDGPGTLLTLNNVGVNVTGLLSDATLTVQNGGSVQGLGHSLLFVGPSLPFGATGNSRVNIIGGGTVGVSDVLIAGSPGGVPLSLVTVSDPGSMLTAANTLRLTGGALDVRKQAQASASIVDIQTGLATVETGATFGSSGLLLIGFNGTGTLTVSGGGQVSSNQSVIGRQAGSTGAAIVSGAGSRWSTFSDFTVGRAGTGSLDISAAGVIDSGTGIVGDQAASNGTATVEGLGSAWQAGGPLTIANQQGSTGTLNIQSQGLVNSATTATIGNAPGTLGTVNVQSGGHWVVAQGMTVGNQGTGQLAIGGIKSEVDSLDGTIASLAGSNGAVSVQIGGLWKATNGLTVADRGSGQLSIDLGGVAIVGAGVGVANAGGSFGTVTVDGALNIGGGLSVGKGGNGVMTVENGGAVAAAGGGHIGELPGSVGTVTVTGSNMQGPSSWTLGDKLAVSEGGTGTLNVTDGGQVQSKGAQVGGAAGSVGTVSITGVGSSWSDAAMIGIGGTGGQGTVNVTGGGKIMAPTIVVGALGKLGGDGGSIVATVVNAGGVVRPGDAPGVLHITGDYVQNVGTLLFEIDGKQPGQFDQLHVSGQATFSGGLIEVEFTGGFAPKAGDAFDLIEAGNLSHGGVGLDVVGLDPGLDYSTAFDANGLVLTLAAVPEPATWLLMGVGLVAVVGGRPGRQQTRSSVNH